MIELLVNKATELSRTAAELQRNAQRRDEEIHALSHKPDVPDGRRRPRHRRLRLVLGGQLSCMLAVAALAGSGGAPHGAQAEVASEATVREAAARETVAGPHRVADPDPGGLPVTDARAPSVARPSSGPPPPPRSAAAGAANGAAGRCAKGRACAPHPIDHFPFFDRRDTRKAADSHVATYACAPSTRYEGGKYWYRIEAPSRGFVRATIAPRSAAAVDVDLLLLDEPSPDSCRKRHDHSLAAHLRPGTHWLVVDTRSRDGVPKAGSYRLAVDFRPLAEVIKDAGARR